MSSNDTVDLQVSNRSIKHPEATYKPLVKLADLPSNKYVETKVRVVTIKGSFFSKAIVGVYQP